MSNIRALKDELVRSILEGDGTTPKDQRRAALDNDGLSEPLRSLANSVVRHAKAIRDEDIAVARASGLSEDQIFELIVCAAVGQADRQYASARAALEALSKTE
jgi:alkylhydroperoxidase family enzyme